MAKNTFRFGTDFQELILQFIVTDNLGFKALELIEESYFTLVHHSVIAYALKKYYKKNKNIPEEPYLREYLRVIYSLEKIMKYNLSEEDQELISSTITRIYEKVVADPDRIIEKVVNYARYVNFKHELENVDIENYDSYEASIDSFRKATNIGIALTENYGTSLIAGMPDRAHKRDISHIVCPTPFWQLNKLLNSGGTTRGNVNVVLSREKYFKTGFLINTARGYLRMRKRGFYADLENGELAITIRSEQSLSNQEQEVITSGEWDNRLLKMFRKYKRLGSELQIKRFSSLTTSTDDLQNWLDKLKRDFGLVFDFGIIDYGVLLGCRSGKQDEFGRISDAFLDIKNLSSYNNLEALWTAAHITREGDKRTGTVYRPVDIAKCMDIPRHCDAVFGLQSNEEEMNNNVMRLEVVEQRNGMREGKCLFWVDIPKQRMREFTRTEVKAYYKELEGESKKRKSDL